MITGSDCCVEDWRSLAHFADIVFLLMYCVLILLDQVRLLISIFLFYRQSCSAC